MYGLEIKSCIDPTPHLIWIVLPNMKYQYQADKIVVTPFCLAAV